MALKPAKPFLFLVFLLSSVTAHCQYWWSNLIDYQYHSEVSVSYGYASIDYLLTGGKYNNHSNPENSTGTIFAAYNYYITDYFKVCVIAGSEPETKGTLYYTNDPSNYHSMYFMASAGRYEKRAYTAAIQATFYVYRKKNFRLYGGIGVGYTSLKEYDHYSLDYYNSSYNIHGGVSAVGSSPNPVIDQSHWTANATFIGLRYGKALYGFAELGLGYKGVINGGVAYIFPKDRH